MNGNFGEFRVPGSDGMGLRVLKPEQLAKVLAAHRHWVESESREGKRADLFGTDLIEANLSGVNFRGCVLAGVNLRGANLRDAEGLTLSQLRFARDWELAFYGDVMLEKLSLPYDHNDRVRGKLGIYPDS